MWTFIVSFFTKHLWNILSVLADIIVVCIFGYALWLLFHPKPTTTQNAGVINNYTVYPDKLDFALGKIGGFEMFSFHTSPPISTVVKQNIISGIQKKVPYVIPKISK